MKGPGLPFVSAANRTFRAMKPSHLFLIIGLGLCAPGTLSAQNAPVPTSPTTTAPDAKAVFRIWHDTQGRPLEATFRGLENGNVFLQTKNGYVHRLPLERLSADDQVAAQTLKPEGLGIPLDPNLAQAAAKIDEIVGLGLKVKNVAPNALASDEQFVRRVYLDLAGRIPTREETMAFLSDTSSSKRAKVIDKLVNGEGFSSRMFNYFADMLRMTDDAQKSKFFTYEEWFKGQLVKNRPWNEIVHEMMVADGKLLDNGATGYLLRDRGMRLDNLSLTLSTFIGANVACAQCHDHPFADWTQRQFYEMAAFFGATETYGGKGPQGPMMGKGLLRGLREELSQRDFQVAIRLTRANGLAVEDAAQSDLTFPDDYKYKDAKPGDPVAPKLIAWTKEDVRSRPYQEAEAALKQKRSEPEMRETFAKWMTSPQNPRFAMTIANRLWKVAFGVAVKEPVTDLDDPGHSNNPMLLNHLASEMVRLKFDIRAYMRLLCNTQTYQREAVTTEITLGDPYYFPGPVLRRMTAEQAWDSCVTLAIGEKVDGYKLKRADQYVSLISLPSDLTQESFKAKVTALSQDRQALTAALGNGNAGGGKPGKGKKARRMMMQQESSNEDGNFAQPEMLEGLVLARASELRQPEREQHFLRMFGQSDRQIADSNSDEGSIPQVLMLMNGEAQHVLRNPRSLVFATATGQANGDEAKIESLYYSFFSRPPNTQEMADAKAGLASGLTIGDLTWVLFNSREFVFVQ